MAYYAVKGGQEAIIEAEKLLRYYRSKGSSESLKVEQIRDQMRLAVDKVMGEGSLYDPDLAALALKQAEGDTLEASFLMRAFRSTLSRNIYSFAIDTSEMEIIRRVSATFKDIPGGQYLGPTRDYTKRILDFELLEENEEHIKNFLEEYLSDYDLINLEELPTFPKVIDILRKDGLIDESENKKKEDHQTVDQQTVDDITRNSIKFPASRAMRLQALARGETGAMMALAYSGVRGYGNIHPTIGELRVGYVPLRIPHPLRNGETITIGRVMVTEVEILASIQKKGEGQKPTFSLGYGLSFGHNEVKAIAMSILDRSMSTENPKAPSEDEEFVLYHIDGIEALGFVSHFKLPHYVDFQADINRLKSLQRRAVENR